MTPPPSLLLHPIGAGPAGRRPTRLHTTPPPAHGRVQPRARLERRLVGVQHARVVLVVAPAGYGKTVLLEAWDAGDPRPFAWVTARGGVGPGLDVIARSLEPIDTSEAFVLVLENADRWDPGALELLLAELPGSATLALACRSAPDLPIGRLRSERRLVELGPQDLAMTHGEAAALLRGAGVRLGPDAIDDLVARTEGWPVGLCLAAVAIRQQDSRHEAVAAFGGGDRLMAEYLQDELLSGLGRERLAFLTGSSILGELSGPLCDAVLDRRGSGCELQDLGRSGLPVVAVDRCDERFRIHGLVAEMLRTELHRAAPELEAELHGRASAWYDERDDPATALDHAIAGGHLDRAAELLWRLAPTFVFDGRAAELEDWLGRLPEAQVARHTALALTAALIELAHGRRDHVDRWLGAAERHLGAAPVAQRDGLEAGLELVRATVGGGSALQMRAGAARAVALCRPDSPWRALCSLLAGVGHLMAGELEQAGDALEDGARRGAVIVPGVEALCLAELALLALLDSDWEQGAVLAERARSRVDRAGLDLPATRALVYAASAFSRAYRGRIDEARSDVAEARRMLNGLDGLAPWYDAQARLALARAQLRLSNAAEARALNSEAARFAARVPDATQLRAWIDDAWARADTFAVEALSGPSSLTTAELRVLRFLPSHLSFREIAERLHVSANTVKTQAHAVYRKLDASSRSAAVARARRFGLIDG